MGSPSWTTKPDNLKADCGNCSGLCCVALYFSASDGFPVDKEAGKPCENLQSDFTCKVHKELGQRGLKGCAAYDCFGAGQKVTELIFNGHSWRQSRESAQRIFQVFLIVGQLQEMLWYLTQVLELNLGGDLRNQTESLLDETERLSCLNADSLLELNIAEHRAHVNALLLQASAVFRSRYRSSKRVTGNRREGFGRRPDLMGQDLSGRDLRGEDFRGALLIAADLRKVDLSGTDLIGADLRDADLRGADLTNTLFLTQSQINSAKGDQTTKLPKSLTRPTHW